MTVRCCAVHGLAHTFCAGIVALATPNLASPAAAQSATTWDATISNSNWYVPVPQLLAMGSSNTSFANPFPLGDQTLWTLGTSTNGVFTGTSNAQLAIGPLTTTSTSNIQGSVTPSGQITMVFTPVGGGATTIGLGQMQTYGGSTQMEMQMITGTSMLVSHWAYMLPYNPATFTPPAAQVVPSNSSPQWAWTEGTPWRIVSPAAFGSAAPGTFIITNYKNGYFWGQGRGPSGGPAFTLLGSITPEGKVLFNTLTQGQLTSLYGGVTGDASAAQMMLGTYDASALFTGDLTYTYLVRPYAETVAASGNKSAIGAAQMLYAIAGTPTGFSGDMAPAIAILNDLSGPALSAAVSQTVPVVAGAASQATANTQRMLGQIVSDRVDAVSSQTSKVKRARQLWARPLGGAGAQDAHTGAPGYRTNGAGIATGMDAAIGPRATVGGLFAYVANSVNARTDWATANMASGSIDMESYVLGLYGAYELNPSLYLTGQLNAGLTDNDTSRAIGFVGRTATANYQSFMTQMSAGLRQSVALTPDLSLVPALRFDYLQVDSSGYRESGAGALDLNVQDQTYRELFLTGELGARYKLTDKIALTTRGSVGHNMFDTATQITSAFAGGGTFFATSGLDVSPWLFAAGAGLTSTTTETLTLGVHYDMQTSPSGYLNQIGSVVAKLRL
jgi:outer membrane autotransporter protein